MMAIAEILLMACTQNKDGGNDTTAGDRPMSDNIAWQDQHVRFSVVSDGIIRLEYVRRHLPQIPQGGACYR